MIYIWDPRFLHLIYLCSLLTVYTYLPNIFERFVVVGQLRTRMGKKKLGHVFCNLFRTSSLSCLDNQRERKHGLCNQCILVQICTLLLAAGIKALQIHRYIRRRRRPSHLTYLEHFLPPVLLVLPNRVSFHAVWYLRALQRDPAPNTSLHFANGALWDRMTTAKEPIGCV